MDLRLYWFLPSHGDGRDVARGRPGDVPSVTTVRREPDLGYLAQVAGAVDELGFTGALVPFGLFCEDPWLLTAALARRTERMRFMVAFRPGLLSPLLAAQMAATLQRLTGGRLDLNVVVGGDPQEQARYGDRLSHDERYARADEFLTVLRGAWEGRVSLEGRYHHVTDATVIRAPSPAPTVFVGGSSPAAREVAVRHGDVHLSWAELPEQCADQVVSVQQAARAAGRRLEFGTRMHVITRDTADEAWAVVEAMVARLDPDVVVRALERFRASDSEGQRRMVALQGDLQLNRTEVRPNIWTGYGLARQGPAITLVGSHQQVADRVADYHEAGLTHLILSGQPHLEEAYHFAEGVLPILRRRGLLGGAAGAPAAARSASPATAGARGPG